ncbi:MAG TPA: SRPBCC domain-containing protein [Ktedonobacteraceae bacterium]|jgi:carbon monoxide dehydrogenase subunit G|nr:SRPBCC domain-containing protein [Ktedonobacteraceae bacterium]
MKLNGTHKFKANSTRVFNAILDPAVLQKCIPGCESVSLRDATSLQVNVTTSLPGLKGPYAVVVNLLQRQDPNLIVLGVKRQGRGGSVDATANINLADEADGALLTYDANAELSGPIAIASTVGKPFVNSTLNTIFENLDKTLG